MTDGLNVHDSELDDLREGGCVLVSSVYVAVPKVGERGPPVEEGAVPEYSDIVSQLSSIGTSR